MISPMGRASEFATWDELKSRVRQELQAANLEMLHYRFFVFSKEWLEVPMPEQWPLSVPPAKEERKETRGRVVFDEWHVTCLRSEASARQASGV